MSNDETLSMHDVREHALALGFANEDEYAEAVMTADDDVYSVSDAEYAILAELEEQRMIRERAEKYEKDRERLRKTLTTPLVLRLQVAPYSRERLYGVFANATEALDWIDSQSVSGLTFAFFPLRSPHRKRLDNDAWYGDHCDSDDDFVAEVSIPE